MHALANILFTIGVCIAAVGAAGFHDPGETGRVEEGLRTTESLAWPLFAGGMMVIVAGSFVQKKARAVPVAAGADHKTVTLDAMAEILTKIRVRVVELDEKKGEITQETLCAELDDLLNGDFFDLVDAREDFLTHVGFTDFARVWESVATGERQLARVWSIATDGFLSEALLNLPPARKNLESAADAMTAVRDEHASPQA